MHAFGANLPDEDPDGNAQLFEYNPRFAGQYFDRETALHYNYFRYYEPETGRYLSPDPIGLAGGVNVYGYASADPLKYFDPYGLFELPVLHQGVVDFSAGLGDALLLGFGSDLRNFAGIGGINQCSDAYQYGGYSSFAAGSARLAYAGLAKAGSILAPSAASASSFRQGLKVTFRGGLFPDFRKRTYEGLRSAGKNDIEIRASAGRTNVPLNVIGAQVGVGGAILSGRSNCGCSQ